MCRRSADACRRHPDWPQPGQGLVREVVGGSAVDVVWDRRRPRRQWRRVVMTFGSPLTLAFTPPVNHPPGRGYAPYASMALWNATTLSHGTSSVSVWQGAAMYPPPDAIARSVSRTPSITCWGVVRASTL
jgi:hypothetical protein